MKSFLLLVLVAFTFAPSRNADCVCIKDHDASEEKVRADRKNAYEQATAIFEGKVVALDSSKITFKLQKQWKGSSKDEVKLSTGTVFGYHGTPLPKECSYQFELGQEYLVYTFGREEKMEAASCLTFKIKEATVEEKLLDQIKASLSKE